MPLFGKSQKSPAELVKALKEAVTALERGDKKAEKAQEDVSKNLVSGFRFVAFVLCGFVGSFLKFKLNFCVLGSYQKYAVRYIRFGTTN